MVVPHVKTHCTCYDRFPGPTSAPGARARGYHLQIIISRGGEKTSAAKRTKSAGVCSVRFAAAPIRVVYQGAARITEVSLLQRCATHQCIPSRLHYRPKASICCVECNASRFVLKKALKWGVPDSRGVSSVLKAPVRCAAAHVASSGACALHAVAPPAGHAHRTRGPHAD